MEALGNKTNIKHYDSVADVFTEEMLDVPTCETHCLEKNACSSELYAGTSNY